MPELNDDAVSTGENTGENHAAESIAVEDIAAENHAAASIAVEDIAAENRAAVNHATDLNYQTSAGQSLAEHTSSSDNNEIVQPPVTVTIPANNQSYKRTSSAMWMVLIGLGFALEFTGRFIGLRSNPLGIWLDLAPLLTTIIAATLIIYGVFRLMRDWAAKNLSGFRVALLTILLGSSMLVASMVSKSIVNLMFG
ncbi:MAG: hypothetical protein LBG68_04655 [Coriobacteriales bacterium]|nr:hypothetical protein [Coriobacteriales bacterium]